MGATAFDTLTAAREIEKAGLDRAAAEAIAGAIRSGQGGSGAEGWQKAPWLTGFRTPDQIFFAEKSDVALAS